METVGDGRLEPHEPERGASTDLDFWSFVALANDTLAREYGFRHQLATELLLTLNRASELVTYDLESSVHRPRGRSWAAFRLMFVVWLAGPLESKSVARLTGTSRAAVSNLTKPLVTEGLLHRRPDEHDGRSVRLSLTEAGRAEMIDVFRRHNERENEWATGLTETEQRMLVMLLDKLISGRRRFAAHDRS
jgi:DNA-binding MarR family transcriptional regulator